MPVPYTFGTATAAIPLSQLDSNFATAITLGNTAVYLGNTTTSIGNLTLTNVTISSGEVTTGNVSVSGNVTLTNGTANGVAYLNGSKVLTTGSALVFDGTNLGVGVTPSSWGSGITVIQLAKDTSISSHTTGGNLFVNSNTYYNGSNWIYSATRGASQYQQNNGAHIWYQAGSGTAGNTISFTQSMTLDGSGNLGLGVTPSAWSLLKGLQTVGGGFFGSNSNSTFVGANWYYDGANKYMANGFASRYITESGTHAWYNAPSGTAGNAITFTQAMTLDASGNLLVGTTTSPSYSGYNTLVLNSATNGGLLDIQVAGSRIGSLQAGSSTELRLFANTSVVTTLYGGGSERARIDTSGNLLVGTTNSNPATTGVTGIVLGPTGGIRQSSGSGASYFAVTSTSGTHIQFYTYNSGAVAAGFISSSGSTTSYTGPSDYRLKENIAPMTGALDKVAQLKPVTYKWKLDGSDGQGFIAHELQAIFPDAVVGEKDATREEQYEVTPAVKDEQGIVVTEAIMGTRTVPDYQGVDTSYLVATLTAAIQEQQAIITQLTARITALESA